MSSLKDTIKEILAEDLSHEKEVLGKVKAELAEEGVIASDEDLCAVFFKMRRSSAAPRSPRPEGVRSYRSNPNNQRFFINIGSVDGLTRDDLQSLNQPSPSSLFLNTLPKSVKATSVMFTSKIVSHSSKSAKKRLTMF